jgi:hypothetical protein
MSAPGTASEVSARTVAIALLACVVFLLAVGTAVGGGAGAAVEPVQSAAPAPPDSSAGAPADTCPDRIDVYYFHRTIRCVTCLTFEAYAWEALSTGFADELDRGRVTWSVLNMDDESNAALVREYDIFESSLVVSAVEGGRERSWEKLEAIWGLVQDKSAFLDYVSAEVDSALISVTTEETEDVEGALPLHRELVPKSDG